MEPWSIFLITLMASVCQGHGDDKVKLPEISIKVNVIPKSKSITDDEFDGTSKHRDGYYSFKNVNDDDQDRNYYQDDEPKYKKVDEYVGIEENTFSRPHNTMPTKTNYKAKLSEMLVHPDETRVKMPWPWATDSLSNENLESTTFPWPSWPSDDSLTTTSTIPPSSSPVSSSLSWTTPSSPSPSSSPSSSSSSSSPLTSTPSLDDSWTTSTPTPSPSPSPSPAPAEKRNQPVSGHSETEPGIPSCGSNCMIATRRDECLSYKQTVLDVYSHFSRLHSLLVYGCPRKNNGDDLCCHGNKNYIEGSLLNLTLKLSEMDRVLRSQCDKCPVDCKLSEWGPWTPCPCSCRHEGHQRSRHRTTVGPIHGGDACRTRGPYEQRETCPTLPKNPGQWSPWGQWSHCSSKCGGTMTRTRRCQDNDEPCVTPCEGRDTQLKDCGDVIECCVDATWGTWGPWSDCPLSAYRNKVSTFRNRTCDVHETGRPICPNNCIGVGTEVKECCTPSAWTDWSAWTECSNAGGSRGRRREDAEHRTLDEDGNPCGHGCRNRTRECINGTCNDGGCQGQKVEFVDCFVAPCCVKADWSSWTEWTTCEQDKCQTRTRTCVAPNGKTPRPVCMKEGCYGRQHKIETKTCPCRPSTWEPWGIWSSCSVSCGIGTNERYRVCSTQSSSHCSQPCRGKYSEKQSCVGLPTVNGAWSMWGRWTACSQSCDVGMRTRQRECDKPAPNACGIACQGRNQQTERCRGESPRHGNWGLWSAWTACSNSCGGGVQSRGRRCNSPAPNRCGSGCTGLGRDTQTCSTRCEPCEESCDNLPNGVYPSLCERGCNHYIICCDGVVQGDAKRCPRDQKYDPSCKMCIKRDSCRFHHQPPALCPRPPISDNCQPAACKENCTGKKDGYYASRCKLDCRSFYRCCNEYAQASITTCPEPRKYYDARAGCCVRVKPAFCEIGRGDAYSGVHDKQRHQLCVH